MARRLTISSGKLALEDATAAMAPNIIVMCAGTDSLFVRCTDRKYHQHNIATYLQCNWQAKQLSMLTA